MMGIMTTTVDSSDSMPERLQEGSVAPDFTLPAVIPGFTESGSINLSDVLDAGRRVVLYFYPAAMTPGCTTEACDFRDNLARLASKNVTVLGVSRTRVTNCASLHSAIISRSRCCLIPT